MDVLLQKTFIPHILLKNNHFKIVHIIFLIVTISHHSSSFKTLKFYTDNDQQLINKRLQN